MGEAHYAETEQPEVSTGETGKDENLPAWAKQCVDTETATTGTEENGTGMRTPVDSDAADQSVHELQQEQNEHLWEWITGRDSHSETDTTDTRMHVTTIPKTRVHTVRF